MRSRLLSGLFIGILLVFGSCKNESDRSGGDTSDRSGGDTALQTSDTAQTISAQETTKSDTSATTTVSETAGKPGNRAAKPPTPKK
jgi:hypothetical protein